MLFRSGEMLAPAAAAALPDVDTLLAIAAENAAASPPADEVPGGAALGTPRPSPVALETAAEELDHAAKWNRWRALLARIMDEIEMQVEDADDECSDYTKIMIDTMVSRVPWQEFEEKHWQDMRQYEGASSFTPEKAKEMLRAVEMKKTRQTYLAAAADCGFSVDHALLRELQRIYDEEGVPDEAAWNLKIFTAGGQETVDHVELGARFVELVGGVGSQ